ncbi:hypothetical protein KI688_001052 [Linnemannia hyalina]|uniref:HCP-like protein n=1 Tax=Linnemannia hyalina TaxID=64524 RepID=A0A9P7Y5F7_9FUNG|nr:hypothetical protein KI688_001052 [Linnemannia hyalina]
MAKVFSKITRQPWTGISGRPSKGYAVGQRKVGVLYNHGLGVKQDYSTALAWYIKSADLGNGSAKTNIGYFYSHGQGVHLDYSKAMEWLLMAADQGDPRGTIENRRYRDGRGVTPGLRQGYGMVSESADQGFAQAQHDIGGLYEHGHGVLKDKGCGVEVV